MEINFALNICFHPAGLLRILINPYQSNCKNETRDCSTLRSHRRNSAES